MAGNYALQRILSQPAGSDGAKIENLIQFLSSGGTGASSSTTISGSTGVFGGFGSGGGGEKCRSWVRRSRWSWR